MPRSPQKVINWRSLALLLAFSLFVSFVLIEAGAQGRRSRPVQNASSGSSPQQTPRKNIASVRTTDAPDGSRVTITSDAPLNDYEAYWGGDRFFVIIPNAEITYQNMQTLQSSLRGRGFQDVRIERKGNDLVFSFRMQAGFRARPEQKFNRLDIILTAPPGSIVTSNRNTGQTVTQGGGTGRPTNTGRPSDTGGTTGTGTSVTTGGQLGGGTSGTSGGGTTASSGSAGGGGGRRITGGRGRGRSGGYTGYGGGGGGDRGGGTPLNIPLPSDIQASQTPSPTPLTTGTPPAATTASPAASPGTGEATAQVSPSPATSLSPTPEQIARNEPPVTAPPATGTTNTDAPAPATNTGFAAAVREYWLPLLIGLLVLGAIVLLMASRSRAESADGRETERRLQTGKQETIKDKPASRTGAAVAGGAAGAAAVAAMAKESRAKTKAPVEEPVREDESKTLEPVAPPVAMEQVSAEAKNLLEGKDYDEAVIASSNPDTRQIVSTELQAALASRNPERRLRAREAFIKHGFFDEATRKLRTSTSSAERISAARALGLTQENSATSHLVAALEDDDPEVRRASVNALAELRDPSAIGPLNALLEREKNRKVPHSLIRRAIEASATIDMPEATAEPPAATGKGATAKSAGKKDKDDDDDREVFEI
ncbi:MAG TPA: HEAT repeat domain-containing protein [Pyrinomonadaceae bacterium]|jgi:hypothetical protein